jgi:hypothetical protein
MEAGRSAIAITEKKGEGMRRHAKENWRGKRATCCLHSKVRRVEFI